MLRVVDNIDMQGSRRVHFNRSGKTASARLLGSLAAAALGFGLLSAPAASAASAYSGAEIVARAASQAGLPYCWAGGNQSGPTHGDGNVEGASHCGPGVAGFDCTGLTIYATGLALAHDSAQATNAVNNFGGQRIYHESELQPGDLVYFGGSFEAFDHVGVYAGGGMMWDADISYWIYPDGVHERTLSSVEHALPFVGGVRLWHEGGGGAPPEGSFVSYQGNVYRIAGGAPLYVSNWSAVGGPQPIEALTSAQWDALRTVPANGTPIASTATGMVYEIAGGAPLYVSNWSAIGGERSAVAVDQWDLDNISNPAAHLNAVPANGTLIASTATGMVYEIAGGAPLYVSNWSAIGGERSAVAVDQWDLDNISNPAAHLNAVPANGTLIASTATGMVYEIAGGAPLYVSNWSAIGGERSAVAVDQWDLDNISNPAAHLNAVPANGTLIASTATGMVYEIAGGAPLYVSNWSAIGGERSAVAVDQWDLDNISNPAAHLNAVPANGTFLNTSTGRVYRIAGGAPFAVSSWSVFGGERPYVTVDKWDLENLTNPAAHLNAAPANSTVVEGLPSGSFWLFNAGLRSPTATAANAVTVDDLGLYAYPLSSLPVAGEGATAQIHVDATKITHPAKPLTAKQRLVKALARCRKIKRAKKRTRCKATARHRYRASKRKR